MSLRAVYDQLISLPVQERLARLETCDLDDKAKRTLRRLLAADAADAPSWLENPVHRVVQDLHEELYRFIPEHGAQVGSFIVDEVLGEGGSAVVFRARRPAGAGEQVVALKVFRAGVLTDDGRKRFLREQAVLAQLTHPAIAHLVEGGVDPFGTPFIAMEYVDGEPITAAVRRLRLPLRERLALFVELCRGIQFAHAALVVHCDLKPSNVLLDGDRHVKVLDFGVSRLVHTDGATRTIVLTPEYAAPEQFRPGPPSTSVDIYALGVILGELACVDVDAPDRSTAAPAAALERDLRAIADKATSKMPSDRYGSVAELALDVERYLAGQPVSARSGSAWYRAVKRLRRNKWTVAAVAAVAIVLLAASLLVHRQAMEADRMAAEARLNAERAESVQRLMFELFSEAEPNVPRAGEVTVADVIEYSIRNVRSDASIEPRIRLETLALLANTKGRRGNPSEALALLREVEKESAERFGRRDALALSSRELIADYESHAGRYDVAEKLLEQLRADVAEDDLRLRSVVLRRSAIVAARQRDLARTRRFGQEAVAVATRLGDPYLIRAAINDYAAALSMTSLAEPAELVAAYEQVLDLNLAAYGPHHERVATAQAGLARAYRRAGRLDEAEAASRAALEIDRRVFVADHWIVANHLNGLIQTLLLKREVDAALAAAERALEICRSTLGPGHADLASALIALGSIRLVMGDYDQAVPALREAVQIRAINQGDQHPATANARVSLGYALALAGDPAGVALLEGAIDVLESNQRYADETSIAIVRRVHLAMLSHTSGEVERWRVAFDQVLPTTSVDVRTRFAGRAHAWQAWLALERNDAAAALRSIDAATAERAGRTALDPLLPVELAVLRARATSALPDPAAAARASDEAAAMLARTAYPPADLVEAMDALR